MNLELNRTSDKRVLSLFLGCFTAGCRWGLKWFIFSCFLNNIFHLINIGLGPTVYRPKGLQHFTFLSILFGTWDKSGKYVNMWDQIKLHFTLMSYEKPICLNVREFGSRSNASLLHPSLVYYSPPPPYGILGLVPTEQGDLKFLGVKREAQNVQSLKRTEQTIDAIWWWSSELTRCLEC